MTDAPSRGRGGTHLYSVLQGQKRGQPLRGLPAGQTCHTPGMTRGAIMGKGRCSGGEGNRKRLLGRGWPSNLSLERGMMA